MWNCLNCAISDNRTSRRNDTDIPRLENVVHEPCQGNRHVHVIEARHVLSFHLEFAITAICIICVSTRSRQARNTKFAPLDLERTEHLLV